MNGMRLNVGRSGEGNERFSHRIDEHIKHHHGKITGAQGTGNRQRTII